MAYSVRLKGVVGTLLLFGMAVLFILAGLHKFKQAYTSVYQDSYVGLNGALTAGYWHLRNSLKVRLPNPAVIVCILGVLEVSLGVTLAVWRRHRRTLANFSAVIVGMYTLAIALSRPYLSGSWCGCTGIEFVDGDTASWVLYRNGVLILCCLLGGSLLPRPSVLSKGPQRWPDSSQLQHSP